MLHTITSNITMSSDSFVQKDKNPDDTRSDLLRLTIPTGRIQEKVLNLLSKIGMQFYMDNRSYRPQCSQSGVEAKMLKPQNIPGLVALGRHDCGFSGRDWIMEQRADIVELLDLEYDPVRIVAAMPEELAAQQLKLTRPLVVASEYRRLAKDYIANKKLNAVFVQSFGATEALPPEDADLIIDNTATGGTLKRNRLVIVDELMYSTTRFICNKASLENKNKRKQLEELTMLMKSTLAASQRVLLEMNVATEDFERIVKDLPCMKSPTVSKLYNGSGYVIKIAVLCSDVPALIPKLVALGARDILEYKLEKLVTQL